MPRLRGRGLVFRDMTQQKTTTGGLTHTQYSHLFRLIKEYILVPPKDEWRITDRMILSEPESLSLLHSVAEKSIRNDANQPRSLQDAVDYLIVSCLLHSGLTNSEFCALRLGDTIAGTRESSFQVQGRKGRPRTVVVPQQVSQLVLDYVRDIRPQLLPAGVRADELDQPLVISERGGRYHRTGLYRRVVRILTQAGFADRASVHLFRHTYGCLAYARTGGNLLFVQRQLGHAYPQITTVYADRATESYQALAERVGRGLMPNELPSLGGRSRGDTVEAVHSLSADRVERVSRRRRELAIGETD